jgi:hypothetical protein
LIKLGGHRAWAVRRQDANQYRVIGFCLGRTASAAAL